MTVNTLPVTIRMRGNPRLSNVPHPILSAAAIAATPRAAPAVVLIFNFICFSRFYFTRYSCMSLVMYLPTMSNSRFTVVPTRKVWKLVCSCV